MTSRQNLETFWKQHCFTEKQFVNRFRNSHVLTRKNLLTKTLQQYFQNTQNVKNFLPQTFVLPEEFEQLQASFGTSKMWIMKPADKARGIGIILIDKLEQIPFKFQKDQQVK